MNNNSNDSYHHSGTTLKVVFTTTMESTTTARCDLTDTFGFFIQGLLAVVAFSTLILKRFREPKDKRRPLKIWFFDTSKQAIGALVIHFANVYLSQLFTGDPCTWYFINYLLDSTVGLCLIYVFLKISQLIVKYYELDTLILGEYGDPPECNAWLGQCGLYILVMVIEKIAVAFLVTLEFWHKVRQFILKPVKKHPKVEVALVMLIIPFIINAIMFWVVDNFLMHKKKMSEDKQNDARVQFTRRVTTKNTAEEVEVLLNSAECIDNERLIRREPSQSRIQEI